MDEVQPENIRADIASQLAPDEDAVLEHLTEHFGDVPAGIDGLAEVNHFSGANGELTGKNRFGLEFLEDAAVYVAKQNRHVGRNCYFHPRLIGPDIPENAFTTDSVIVSVPGPWVDIDDGDTVDAAKAQFQELQPTEVVFTGRVPHARVQAYWKVAGGLTNLALVRELKERACATDGRLSKYINDLPAKQRILWV